MHEIENDLIVKELEPTEVQTEQVFVIDPGSVPSTWYVKFGRRFFELISLLIIAVPLLAVISIIYVVLLVPNSGKPIFRQRRIGLQGKPFFLYKFKTLLNPVVLDIEKDTGIIRKNSHPVGIFLRKTGLDELLQVINVLKGEMSLIGPRPLIPADLMHLKWWQFDRRHSVKPGILGLWQIRRKYEYDRNFFRYDDFYIKKQSLLLDLYIIKNTIAYVLYKRGR